MIAAFRNFLAVAAALALAACGSGEREVDRAAAEGILLVGNYGEPQTLDPHLVLGVPEMTILRQLMEPLTVVHPSDPAIVTPGLAESWEHDETATTWTFKLRENGQWSNGDPIVAGDLIYSWRRLLTPELGAQDAEALYVVQGAEAFNLGATDDFSAVGVSAPDDYTFIVELIRPMPYFDFTMAAPGLGPINQRALEAHGTMADRQNPWATVENFVSNGPFRLKEWRVNQFIELEKDPNYWDAANVRLNGVRYFPIDNAKTEENSFFDGRLHVTSSVPADKIPYHRENNPEVLRSEPALGNYYYYINVEAEPFNDVRVRQALSLSINRDLLVDRVVQGGQQAASGFMPSGYPNYQSSSESLYDPERARQLLAEAGYPGGEGFPFHEILMNTSEVHRRVAEAVQEMWRSELGIEVGIYNQEWRVYLDALLGGDFSIARAGLNFTTPEVYDSLEAFKTGGSRNMGGWNNPRFDALIDEAGEQGDIMRRNALLQQAEAIMNEDLPVIPFYWNTSNFLLDPQVRGWEANLYGYLPLKNVYFDN